MGFGGKSESGSGEAVVVDGVEVGGVEGDWEGRDMRG